ncbi:hypothetical protein PIB30_098555 [Stylosanthes scabra]|uniref:CCHC-type domain-containing protein n=1 Tax=Stylosanthes scabra TaxID=79078 RepID=A0ABU6UW39_9FABA|nr:hypothetical protein [Stylosanthes scabra]
MPCVHAIASIRKRRDQSNTNYLKVEAPIIKRPIGKPKVHNRRKDPVEDLIDGPKLKRTFKVTCAKCGEKGHNYKTCKCAPANPNWKLKIRRARMQGNQVEPSQTASQPPPTTSHAHLPFKSLAQVRQNAGTSRAFRAKQPVRRQVTTNSPPPSEPPTPS